MADLFEGLEPHRARYAAVAVPVPAEGTYTYGVPPFMEGLAAPGMRVRVDFGGRRVTGVVVATSRRAPEGLVPGRIRPLRDCLDPVPILSPVLLAVTRWVAERYWSGWGEAVRCAVPLAAAAAIGRRRVALTPAGRAVEPGEGSAPATGGPATASLLAALRRAGGGGLTLGELARRLGGDGVCARAYLLEAAGRVRVEDEWKAGIGGRWERGVRCAAGVDRQEARQATERAPAQRQVLEALWEAGQGGLPVRRVLEEAGCGEGVVRALLEKGLVASYREPAGTSGTPAWKGGADGVGTFDLTAPQEAALARIQRALREAAPAPLLLHGVTGSGKTEVYLRAALTAVEAGRRAMLLVPEIGLTPLLEQRARAVLGERVAVMHSGMSAGERQESWWRARRGRAPVVIGPRSAVFAPLEDVGLIVLDEEQDAAYKQDERPRYHGREVALERARLEGAAVVLGSATPAVESFQRARDGEWEILTMPGRVSSRPLPAVEIVDMRQEYEASGRTLLATVLEEALAGRFERHEQALLLLNRRGFAAAMLCRVCGERVQCPHCAVSLTLHRQERVLRCHYCDHRGPVPDRCPHCDAAALQELGHGTQQLQGSLQRRFPAATIRRFDADETRRRGSHARILAAFAAGDIDLLVGTQMLAKGHDFPGVTLVGVVGADDALGLPDFRAAERSFQLLTQMAGRAGRGDKPGRVILQAWQPDHYAIQAAAGQDYDAFFRREIVFRRRLGYPPFAALIACVCQGPALPAVKEEADVLAAAVRRAAGDGIRVLGPASPPLARLRGRHRLQVLVCGPGVGAVRDVLRRGLVNCAERGRTPRDLRIDVDPLDLM